MQKPGILSLSAYGKDFVFGHRNFLWRSLRVTFPLIILITLANQLARANHVDWVLLAMFVPTMWVYGCYVLGWHRASLRDNGDEPVINPVRITRADLKFLGFFVLLTGGFSLFTLALQYGTAMAAPRLGPDGARLASIASLILMLGAMYVFIRLSFILPAQSVGVTLKLRDVLRSSKGMAWKLIGANVIYGLLFAVLIIVYRVVVEIVLRMSTGGEVDVEAWQAILLGMFLAVPIQLVVLTLIAMLTAMLSRAYQWGIENNPLVS